MEVPLIKAYILRNLISVTSQDFEHRNRYHIITGNDSVNCRISIQDFFCHQLSLIKTVFTFQVLDFPSVLFAGVYISPISVSGTGILLWSGDIYDISTSTLDQMSGCQLSTFIMVSFHKSQFSICINTSVHSHHRNSAVFNFRVNFLIVRHKNNSVCVHSGKHSDTLFLFFRFILRVTQRHPVSPGICFAFNCLRHFCEEWILDIRGNHADDP